MPWFSYNDTMDTIIYLKTENRNQAKRPEALSAFCRIRMIKSGHGIIEGDQLLVTELPWDVDENQDWIWELAAYLRPFWGYSAAIETLTDPGFDSWLQYRGLRREWEKCWYYPPYQGMHRLEYAQLLLQKALHRWEMSEADKRLRPPLRLYVLDYEAYLPELLAPYLDRIASIQLVMTQKRYEQTQQLPKLQNPEAYLDHLSEEEGLAGSCKVIRKPGGYVGFRLECMVPTLVLDFTGEKKIIPFGAVQELYWIDMDASEEKRRRLTLQCAGISYFSMKEEWRSLDTARKNGYNTLVN